MVRHLAAKFRTSMPLAMARFTAAGCVIPIWSVQTMRIRAKLRPPRRRERAPSRPLAHSLPQQIGCRRRPQQMDLAR